MTERHITLAAALLEAARASGFDLRTNAATGIADALIDCFQWGARHGVLCNVEHNFAPRDAEPRDPANLD